MFRCSFIIIFLYNLCFAQTYNIAYDTLTFIKNGKVLKHATVGGLNSSLFYDGDFNEDGKKDFVIFELGGANKFGVFKCFINKGTVAQPDYRYDYRLSRSFPLVQNWAVLLDFNADGKTDLFAHTNAGIRAYRNTGFNNGEIQWKVEKVNLNAIYTTPTGTFLSSIYASSYGYPAIFDLDYDGDYDILSFGPTGNFLDAFKNISKETFNHTDSLVFQHWDFCWGNFSEFNCGVNMNACRGGNAEKSSNERHAGASLLAYDHEGNNTPDLLLHDIGCKSTIFLRNGGTPTGPLITDTTIMFPNYPNKNSTRIARMDGSGCRSSLADIDGDGKKELIITPSMGEFENAWSVWSYSNTSSTSTVNWVFKDSAFMQSEMVDAGFMSRPVLIDIDADGKKDLLLGSYGTYSATCRVPSIHYYKNVGSNAIPSFSFITDNFLNLRQAFTSTVNMSMIVCPGDIDSDGDADLIISQGGRTIHWYENTAGAGNPCNFSQLHLNPFGINSSFSMDYQPFVFDYDNDNKPDIIMGLTNGKFQFYKNTTTGSNPSFSLISGAFPGLEAKGDFFIYGNNGFSCPYLWRENNQIFMLAGNTTGRMYLYQMPASVSGNAVLLDSSYAYVYAGTYSTPWFEDINGDGKRDLFTGNAAGGITFFSSQSPFVGLTEHNSSAFHLYPNPANDYIIIKSKDPIKEVFVFDLTGKKYDLVYDIYDIETHVYVGHLPYGFYIFEIRTTSGIMRKSCIINR